MAEKFEIVVSGAVQASHCCGRIKVDLNPVVNFWLNFT